MNKILKTFLGILIILIPAAITLGLLFNYITKKSFYEETGDIRLPGILNEVKVYNDEFGVPHVFGESDNDVFFTLGYLHARDRLWQMDLNRRAAEGRLSEIMGNRTLEIDKYFRTIGIGKASYNLYAGVSGKTKEILTSYANGVNVFIEEHYNKMPLEFDALNYKPEPWKPENSIMIGRLMGWFLNFGFYGDYAMGNVINKVGLDKAREIFPDTTHPFYKKPVSQIYIPDSLVIDSLSIIDSLFRSKSSTIDKKMMNAYTDYMELMNISPSFAASNAWVISGNKTASGKPILANDPHLPLSAPGIWYEAFLKSNEFEARGMTMAGIPAILIGHTRYIAWGLSSLMNDETDYIVMQRDSADNTKFRYRNTLFDIDSVAENIIIRDSNTVEFIIYTTPAGPVVSDLDYNKIIYTNELKNNYLREKVVTFRWTGFEPGDEILSFYNLLKAMSWNDFRNALRGISNPSFNVMYADVNGNIGYQAAGKVPVRTGTNFEEIYPVGDPGWNGFVEFDKMPSSYNPQEGFLVSANSDPFNWMNIPIESRFYMSYGWEASSRYDRAKEFLTYRTSLDFEDIKLLQMNQESYYAKEISGYLLNAFKDYKTDDMMTVIAVEKFANWNGDMNSREVAASIFNNFFIKLLKNVYLDEMGQQTFRDFTTVANVPIRSIRNLLNDYDSNYTGWFDDISTPYTETREGIIRKSLHEAIKDMRFEYTNPDINSWTWGEKHITVFSHPFGEIPGMDVAINIGPFETGGHNTTLNNGDYNLYEAYKTGRFRNKLGPSMRFIIDFGNIDNGYSVNSTGQSGQPLHKNYQNQSRLWYFGDYKITTMTESDMMASGYTILRLLPVN